MPVTPADIVNQAVQLIGGFDDQGPITGVPPVFDNSPIGIAAGVLYAEAVATVGREHGYDFSRNIAQLSSTGNPPPPPWRAEYLYPTNGIQVRQLMMAQPDPLNPIPVNYTIGNTLVGSTPRKVIWANISNALAVFTNTPPESLWDSLFTQAVVRLLANGLAMATQGKPETAQSSLQESMAFEQLGEKRND